MTDNNMTADTHKQIDECMLLPCPRCSGEGKKKHTGLIECESCRLCVFSVYGDRHAISAWKIRYRELRGGKA